MAIDFPNNPVNGTTYDYLGVRYTFDLTVSPGFWKVTTPGSVSIASGAEIDAEADTIKYITPEGLAASDYIKESNLPVVSVPPSVVVSSGSNANGYYRIWSDGYKEQWGKLASEGTWTYPIAFTEIASIDPGCNGGRVGGNQAHNNDFSTYNITLTTVLISTQNSGGEDIIVRASGY